MRITLATTEDTKALATAHVEATQPRFELGRIVKDGIVCLEVSVINAESNPELLAFCRGLGMVAEPGTQDRLIIIVESNAALDAVRNPLKRFFGKA